MNKEEYEKILDDANKDLNSNERFLITATGFEFKVDGKTHNAIIDFHSSTSQKLKETINKILNDNNIK